MINTVLVVEDSADDVFFLKRALVGTGVHHFIRVVSDGQAAMDYLAGEGEYGNRKEFPVPSLVLLDIKLPKRNGHEVLRWLRGRPEYKTLPVVMLTSSAIDSDIELAQSLGVTSYMVKDSDLRRFRESIVKVVEHWLGAGDEEPRAQEHPPLRQALRW